MPAVCELLKISATAPRRPACSRVSRCADVAVDGRDPLVGQPAHGLEVQLDDDGLELILEEQPDERPAHRPVADDHDPVAIGFRRRRSRSVDDPGAAARPDTGGSPMNRRSTALDRPFQPVIAAG